MDLRISNFDRDREIVISLDKTVVGAMQKQIQQLCDDDARYQEELEALAQQIGEAMLHVLETNMRPPNPSQVKFAMEIARLLNINLPGEALKYRRMMNAFLNQNAALYYAKMRGPGNT
jgi:hypothetical protein